MRNKRGQFYLIAAMIIIAMVIGLVTIVNTSQKQEFDEIIEAAEELSIEAEAVLDEAVINNKVVNTQIGTFIGHYIEYTNVENVYFFYGEKPEITIKAYRKKTPARIGINIGGDINWFDIQNGTDDVTWGPSTVTGNLVTITIGDISHEFNWLEGNNFYYILSEGNEKDEEYVFSGNAIRSFENEA